MKSMFADCNMVLKYEEVETTFLGETFKVLRFYNECPISGLVMVSNEVDNCTYMQIYNQYRAKHNIPGPDEIIRYKMRHNLTNRNMQRLLGVDEITYLTYEDGYVMSEKATKKFRALLAEETEDIVKKQEEECEEYQRKMESWYKE